MPWRERGGPICKACTIQAIAEMGPEIFVPRRLFDCLTPPVEKNVHGVDVKPTEMLGIPVVFIPVEDDSFWSLDEARHRGEYV